jgi:virulence-associated protein VagC
MAVERRVKLFRNGRNAVRIPRDLELPGNEAVLRRSPTAQYDNGAGA